MLLTDGTREPLDPDTLTVDAESVPRVKIKNGECDARFSRTAWMQLTEAVTEDGQGGYVLHVAGRPHPLKVPAEKS